MSASTPIAIIGMGCRLPGGASSPEKLWKLVSEGGSGWCKVPKDRWNSEAFYHPDPEHRESLNAQSSYFLQEDVSHFDARFFKCPVYEGSTIDPQGRLLLEVSYEALENAGIPIESLKGSDTSVFVGVYGRDYDRMGYKDLPQISKTHTIGTGEAVLSNRISYIFDLKGASMTIDTGCSASMVALHQACLTLKAGESRMAIVGGTELLLHPDQSVTMSSVGMVNPDGKCYVFDSRGSGYGRGEGVGAVVLKRLDDAIQDGDPIHSVIVNSALNQDGKTAGISLPNPDAQAALMRQVYCSAGIDPGETLYVETHGTGTQAGDNAEASSISRVFCEESSTRKSDLYIGSVKSNIGHLEAASGVAGLIKTVLVLKHGQIPPHLDLINPKPSLKLEEREIKVTQELRSLIPAGHIGPQRASLNSFGYGGTNCHVILEAVETALAASNGRHSDAINGQMQSVKTNGTSNGTNAEYQNGQHCDDVTQSPVQPALLFTLSAASEAAATTEAKNLRDWIGQRKLSYGELENLSYTLHTRRSLLSWRSAVVAATQDDLLAGLGQAKALKSMPDTSSIQLTFVFTGQGAQWFAMGRELISCSSVFRESIQVSDEILRSLGCEWSLLKELTKAQDESLISRSEVSQPSTTAIQLALVDLLADLDLLPMAVVGHSSGEIAAAFAAGALTHEGAMTVSYYRGIYSAKAKQTNSVPGSMLAVGSSEETIAPLVKQAKLGKIRIACVNSPDSVTVSGDEPAIDELQAILDARDIFARKLMVDTAYHSHHMEAIAKDYLESLAHIKCQDLRPDVSFYSSVTGQVKTTGFDAAYWAQNLVSQVRFSHALQALVQGNSKAAATRTPCNVFVELGPHAALMGPIRQTLAKVPDYKYTYASCLQRGKDACNTAITVAARLYELGMTVNFKALMGLKYRRDERSGVHFQTLTDLPTYPWDHNTRYWYESRLSRDHRLRKFPYHDLVGLLDVASNVHEPRWRYHLSVKTLPWLKHHVVDGMLVFPGAGYLTMAVEAMKQLMQLRSPEAKIANFVLRNITFSKPVILKDEQPDGFTPEVELQLVLTRNRTSDSSPWEAFRVLSYDADGSWSEHSSGLIMADTAVTTSDRVDGILDEESLSHQATVQKYLDIEKTSDEAMGPDEVYSLLRSTGNDFGSSFATLSGVKLGAEARGVSTVTVPNIRDFMPKSFMQSHVIHPTTLDAINQIAAVVFKRECSNSPLMPVFMGELIVSSKIFNEAGKELLVAVDVTPEGKGSASGNTWCFQKDDSGNLELVCSTLSWQLRSIGEEVKDTHSVPFHRKMNYTMEWENDVDFLTNEQFNLRVQPGADHGVDAVHNELELNEQAAAIYLRTALDQVRSSGDEVPTPHMSKLLQWAESFLQSEAYHTILAGIRPDEEESLLERSYESGVEGQMLARIGKKLPSILAGRVDPLGLMLQDNLLNRFYTEGMVRYSNTQLIKYAELLAFKKPHMTILEIGAGTGDATLSLIQALDRPEGPLFEKYHYTDVSADTLDKAKPKFAAWSSFIEYSTLDITKDPLQQGFEASKYDLILCSNVLHATPSITETIAYTRSLLKPGGRLAMVEMTRPTAAVNLTFGTLPGWWASQDNRQLGGQGPLLSREAWNDVLATNSFGEVELASYEHDGPLPRTSMMVFKAIESNVPAQPARRIGAIQILSTSHSPACDALAPKLLESVQNQGFECTRQIWNSELDLTVEEDTVYILLDSATQSILASPGSEESFEKLKTLLITSKFILWISLSEETSPTAAAIKGLVTGLARVVRRENDGVRFITLDIQDQGDLATNMNLEKVVDVAMNVAKTAFWPQVGDSLSDETEFRLRRGQLIIPRAQADSKFNHWIDQVNGQTQLDTCAYQDADRPLKLEVETPGLLSSLRFAHDDIPARPLGRDEIQLDARAYGVNFRDVFIALGQMLPGLPMAGECSGVVTAVGSDLHGEYKVGDRVMGMGAQPFSSHPRLKGHWAHALPSTLDIGFDAAASMPIIFLTAYHCLIDIAHLDKGQSVLIQAASGGVGQAAIQLAQWLGAEIFATVGSAEKRKLIMEEYGIPATHIFSSRNTSFKEGVLRMTGGRGVDVVLNSLAGEMLTHSWECVAPLGFHIEIGKADIYKRSHLNMVPFDKSTTFAAVDLLALFSKQPMRMYRSFGEIVKLLQQGVVRAVTPLMTLDMDHVEQAFRLIAGRKHTGKVILNVPEGKTLMVKAVAPPPPALRLDPNGTYIVAGGLGDLGRRIARVLASHGAGHILSLSRRVLDEATKRNLEEEIRSLGAQLHIAKCDITDNENVQAVASMCRRNLAPIKGIIHGGMVLRDHPLVHMTLDDWTTALAPKVTGTINLDAAFASSELDFFIMLSSVTCILGKTGQSNYSAGNAFQDAFAHAHQQARASLGQSRGTRYIALNLGAVDGSDAITSLPLRQQEIMRASTVLMSFDEVFKVLEYAMGPQATQDGCVQTIMGFDRESMMTSNDDFAQANPILSMLPYTGATRGAGASGDGKVDVQALLRAAKSSKDAQEVIIQAIVEKFAVFLDRPIEDVSLDQPLATFGMDSLVSIEVKNWMVRSFEVTLQASEVTGAASIPLLAELIVSRSKLISDDIRGTETSDPNATVTAEHPAAIPKDASNVDSTDNDNVFHGHSCCKKSKVLPRQPIPDLEGSLSYFVSNASHFARSPQELEDFKSAVTAFIAEGSTARQIYDNLAAQASNTEVESWSADVIAQALHLTPRFPLMHKSFSATHHNSPVPHTQAERAALIADAAFRNKQALEAGDVEGLTYFGAPFCMSSWDWLYNATREPHTGCDKMRKYDGDYCVVLRHGRVFKVALKDGDQNLPFTRLKDTFQAILDASPDDEQDSSVGLLTSDDRDSWAKTRETLLGLDPQNAMYLHTIDAAAFLVCLDDTEARTNVERVRQAIMGDGSNRWYDKCVQFVVAKNGTSSFIVEHSMIDGQTVSRMNETIHDAIREYSPSGTYGANGKGVHEPAMIDLEEHVAVTSPEIQAHIETLRERHLHMASQRQYAYHSLPTLNNEFLASYNVPIKGVMDVTIQLASCLYFGSNPASWEAVSLARFHKGRPDMMQHVSKPVASFCSAAANSSVATAELKTMMLEAAKDINANLQHVMRGENHYSLLDAIKALWPRDQEMPEMFRDPVYMRAQPGLLISGLTDWSSLDSSYLLVWPEAFWLLYSLHDKQSIFSIVGPSNGVARFEACLDKAADIIKSLVLIK